MNMVNAQSCLFLNFAFNLSYMTSGDGYISKYAFAFSLKVNSSFFLAESYRSTLTCLIRLIKPYYEKQVSDNIKHVY